MCWFPDVTNSYTGYAGIRVQLGGQYQYGWLQIHNTPNQYYLESYACTNFTSSIKNVSNLYDISIYLNPAQNNFTIKTNINEKQMVFVFDVNGKLVFNQFINGKTCIDAVSLNAGVYSLNITSNQSTVTKKLVIVK